ncbi:uncharacterized protein LOC130730153 [Lotus japonicus]|uniref:uncharacterized protein LOC130730153 n=1 Tax=Lotus japonicus TaxID=34305 RepID=UPI0025837EEF|nr:uncharacterized protein LOC130730153 [Lotus japonicus]
MVEADHALATIKRYEEASGQRVNFDKTELSFSQNVPEQLCTQIRNRMEVKVVDSHDKYLGLPTVIGRSKKAVFLKVQERMVKKLKGWKEKFLSRAGKEVLLKSVAQAIPIYLMSCFRLPENVCSSMASLMANFWWGQKNSEKKIHWMSWANLCKPKASGGLGFRDFKSFNEALLAKQVWRLIQNEESILFKCLKARYFPRTFLLSAPVGFRPSYAWRSICSARNLIKEESVWKCHWVRQVWFASSLSIRSGDIQLEIDKWIQQLACSVGGEIMDQIAMVLWSIWKARNESFFKKIKPDVCKSLDLAINLRTEWLCHQPQFEKMGSSSAVWTPPPSGSMKLNFDAGWAGPRGQGFGLVVRDDKGAFQVAASHYEDHRSDPLVAEALSFRWALKLAAEWNLDNLVIVSDCQQLVTAFHQCYSFPSLKTNVVAHALAAESHLYPDCAWWGDPPVTPSCRFA